MINLTLVFCLSKGWPGDLLGLFIAEFFGWRSRRLSYGIEDRPLFSILFSLAHRAKL